MGVRFVVAMMKHETNTFSPVATPLESFGLDGPLYGQAALDGFRDTNTPFAAFVDIAEAEGAEVVTPIAAEAWPSGPVAANAYRHMSDVIREAVAAGCDALFLDLHGAMVSEATDDGEGTLLRRIRALAPDMPIAVALDLHANMTSAIADNADAIASYRTYPHIDMYETGERVGRILIGAIKGEIKAEMVWGNRPMLPHTLCMRTDIHPMGELVEKARAAEDGELLAATVFGGFPLADFSDAGLSVVTMADGGRDKAEAACEELLDDAWALRADFVYQGKPLAESVAGAKALGGDGLVVMVDHADNCASGGTQDTMAVVAEVLRQGLDNVAVGAIRDAEAVARMIEAGVGATITLALGGKLDMPSIGRVGEPLEVSGTVRTISDGIFTIRGPVYTGVQAHMGRTAVLDTGKVKIVVIERNFEPWDLGVFQCVGIEPTVMKYIVLKSRLHFRGAFMPITKHVINCDGVGVTSSDNSLFRFAKVRRPIYPLDLETEA
jgi:microcystin degradation protein MlrC